MKAVTEGEKMSIRAAAAQFNIPYPTLRKHIIKGSMTKSLGRFCRTFSDAQEVELVDYMAITGEIYQNTHRCSSTC